MNLCRYILQGGNSCQQAAINGEHYCRHHLVVRRTVAANTPKQNPYRVEKPLPLVFPEDRAALQINIFVVMQAFNEGQIGHKSAHIFTRLLHECAVNLKQGPLYDSDHENAVRRVVVTPEGEEIAPAREVPENDESVSEQTVSEEQSGESAHQQVSEKEETKAAPRPGGNSRTPADAIACNDPLYVQNLIQRREQYAQVTTYELAAGRDPRPWENFIPSKSKVRKPKVMVG